MSRELTYIGGNILPLPTGSETAAAETLPN